MAANTRRRDVITELYTSLCGDPELPAQVQWRIYRYAAREKKPALMARLLSIPHLDAELDAELGNRVESKVRAAWIGRAGRPVADVLAALDGARKGPVYTAAASVPGLPRAVYRQLAGDGRADTARELLKNPDAPLDVKETAALTFGELFTSTSPWKFSRTLGDLFTDQLGLLPHLVAKTANLSIIAFAADRVALSEHELTRLLDTVIMPELTNPEHAPGWERAHALTAAVRAVLTQPHLPRQRRQTVYRSAVGYLERNSMTQGYQARELTDAWNRAPATLPSASHPHLDLMRSAETPEQVAAAAKIALAGADGELATALACNPATDAGTVVQVLSLIPKEVRSRVARARARDIDVLAAVVVHNDGYDIFSDDLLAASGRPAEALVAIAREYRITGKKVSVRLGRSEFLTPSVMGALPLSFTAKKGSMLARRAVGDLLTTALDADGDWELFETLGRNFDGPLENLLLACGYVAGSPDNEPETEPETVHAADGPDGQTIDPDGIATWSLF